MPAHLEKNVNYVLTLLFACGILYSMKHRTQKQQRKGQVIDMDFKEYLVEYETDEGAGEMVVEAGDPSSASDVCFYEHSDEPGYREIRVLEW